MAGTQIMQQVAELIKDLQRTKNIKKHDYKILGSPRGLSVTSYRLQDYDYKRPNLPTYARGLFTVTSKNGELSIAARGYDKFFNVGEVSATKWEKLGANTKGPYELTVKENGCIIFLSGLEDDKLLVCSKHSTGTFHSTAAEVALSKQLLRVGRTSEELARELRGRNATLVVELCDDEFEEHVLAYPPEDAGLYVHGMNANIPGFVTYPMTLVQQFAERWGFRQIKYEVMETIGQVKTFLEDAAETGAYQDRQIEGFVVRCKTKDDSDDLPTHSFFFKYKFDEPYLMYRHWRECTKAMLCGGTPPRSLKHDKITQEYLVFARQRFASDRKLGALYQQNHGIISLRADFLKYKQMQGSDAAKYEEMYGHQGSEPEVLRRVVLVPIATIGCGKTTVGLALSKLFGWAHVQNDNITGKARPPRFAKEVINSLQNSAAVVADRNNSERRERKQIITDVRQMHATAQLVALNFVHGDKQSILQVTKQRVLCRGDKHQTIQAATDPHKAVGIMNGFIKRFEPCDTLRAPDNGFDHVIELDPVAGSRANVEVVVRKLHDLYPSFLPYVPSAKELDLAYEYALQQKPPVLAKPNPDQSQRQRAAQAEKKAKPTQVVYVSLDLPARDIHAALDRAFATVANDGTKSLFYMQLKKTRRVQDAFHVTLIHCAHRHDHPDLWQRYNNVQAATAAATGTIDNGTGNKGPVLGQVDVQLERVVWDNQLMAIKVRLLPVPPNLVPADLMGAEALFLNTWTSVNVYPHVTVGTRGPDVKSKESNHLLFQFMTQGSGSRTGIDDLILDGQPVVRGEVRCVYGRN